MVPPALMIIPFYQLFVWLGLYNSLISLIIAHAAYSIPFSVLCLSSFLGTIPKEIEEVAYLDGTSMLRIIFEILFPLSLPGITAVAIYAFLISWNDYIFASLLITSRNLQTLQEI